MSADRPVILCVDDDPDMLASLAMVLDAHGFETVVAGDSQEGADAWRQRNPDLMIVDLMMGELDAGVGLVRLIRRSDTATPVLMLSSVGDTLSMTADTSQLGLSGVLQKPVDPAALVRLVRSKLPDATPDDQ